MYKLRDFLTSILGMSHDDVASDELYCSESNTKYTFLTNQMQDTLACYSYTLVHDGWLELLYNGRMETLQRGDLMIYSPGVQIRIINGSKNYHSACLIIDEQAALEIPAVRNVVHTAYQPIAELGRPIIHLDDEQVGERTTELFVAFMRLLTKHFMARHDIAFYADQLCISPVHLSRVVRQVTGRTVADYINQMLLMEATWLLRSTDMPLADIAERLHFADQSSFGRFFARMKGTNPKRFRME